MQMQMVRRHQVYRLQRTHKTPVLMRLRRALRIPRFR